MSDKMYNHSRFILERLDRQYDKVNYKINLYIAVNAAIITILTFLIKDINLPSDSCWLWTLYYIVIVLVIVFIIGLTVRAIILLISLAAPFLPDCPGRIGNGREEGIPEIAIDFITNKKSGIYFEHIASQGNSFFNNYVNLFKDSTVNMNADILSQIYILSQGLTKRNESLKHISYIMKISMILIAVLLILKLVYILFFLL